jgi:branched-chain amino acid transport system substrate-binding protein
MVVLAGCGGSPTSTPASKELTVQIATDLPMQGGAKDQSEELVKAIQLYLEEIHHQVGPYTIALRSYDDSTAAKGAWDDETCVKNAHEHLRSKEVAVVGTYNSGCARLEVPILNQASDGPLLMVSHANTNPGLTTTWGPNEPAKFAPSGTKGFARVTPIDSVHGAAAAEYLKKMLHRQRCYIVNDGGVYGLGVAKAFTQAATERGLKVLGNTTWDHGQKSYRHLFETIAKTNADCLYVAGGFENNGGQLIKDKVAVLGDNQSVVMMAPDGMSGYPELQGMPEAVGMYITAGGLPVDELVKSSPVAKSFADAFKSSTGKDLTSAYSVYGVAALQVILAAVEKSDGTRKSVNASVFGSANLSVDAAKSITGRVLTIEHSTGDLISPELSITQIRHGKEAFVSSQVVR